MTRGYPASYEAIILVHHCHDVQHAGYHISVLILASDAFVFQYFACFANVEQTTVNAGVLQHCVNVTEQPTDPCIACYCGAGLTICVTMASTEKYCMHGRPSGSCRC